MFRTATVDNAVMGVIVMGVVSFPRRMDLIQLIH